MLEGLEEGSQNGWETGSQGQHDDRQRFIGRTRKCGLYAKDNGMPLDGLSK